MSKHEGPEDIRIEPRLLARLQEKKGRLDLQWPLSTPSHKLRHFCNRTDE